MFTLLISDRPIQRFADLHRDGRVGTTESITSEDLAIVVEAVD